jgi:MRG-binding protein
MSQEDDDPASPDDSDFLSTVEGEISFFRSIMRARPVGIHRHFHVLAIRNAILKDTGQDVSIEDIWAKLQSCYELDALENLVSDAVASREEQSRSMKGANG